MSEAIEEQIKSLEQEMSERHNEIDELLEAETFRLLSELEGVVKEPHEIAEFIFVKDFPNDGGVEAATYKVLIGPNGIQYVNQSAKEPRLPVYDGISKEDLIRDAKQYALGGHPLLPILKGLEEVAKVYS
jgi:hypothetical protein